ncbi:hypothetical protein [Flavobacterium sp.]|uniref:hypothetical protein n=1 Tax=Flavobacterium sp. TaxID=239 RepID=UPI00122104C4|nr:hypothetical protein [Flavobacterium sp.]RZJ73992.1 MAG: hypothetical protein EOO49_01150 [Flavobacterium sp.]
MGLGNFFKRLFGGPPENGNEPPPIETANDPVKDASDYYAPQPEIMSETTEPIVEKTSAFANEGNEDIEDIRQADRESENRFEEPAD